MSILLIRKKLVRIAPHILLVLFVSCSVVSRPTIDVSGFEPVPAQQQASIVEQLRSQAQSLKSLRALYAGVAKKSLGQEAFEQAVAFERPDKIRIDFFATGLRQDVGTVVATQGQVQAYDPRENIVYFGPADQRSIEQVLSVPFALDDLMLWFCGLPSVEDFHSGSRVLKNSTLNKIIVEIVHADGTLARVLMHIEPTNGAATNLVTEKLELVDTRTSHALVSTTYALPAEGELCPHHLSADILARGVTVTLDTQKVTLNKPFASQEIFVLDAPSSAEVRPLESSKYENYVSGNPAGQ